MTEHSLVKVQSLTAADSSLWNGVCTCSCGKRSRWSEAVAVGSSTRELFRSHYDRDQAHPYTEAVATLLRAWGDEDKVVEEVGRWTPDEPGPAWARLYATSQL